MQKGLLKLIYVVLLIILPILLIKQPHIKALVEKLEAQTIDWRFQLRGPLAPTNTVVIFDLDDQTLNRYPLALSRRSELAKIIQALSSAKVLCLDLLFHDQENLLDLGLKQKIQAHLESQKEEVGSTAFSLLEEVLQALNGDEALEKALGQAQILMAFYFKNHQEQGSESKPSKYLARGRFGQIALKSEAGLGFGLDIQASKPLINPSSFSSQSIVHSIDQLQGKAKGLGYALALIDHDGIVREGTTVYHYQGQQYIPFAFQAIALYEEIPRANISYDFNQHILHMKDKFWQFQGEHFLINYRGPSKTIPTYSVAELLDQKISPQAWENKIVILSKSYLQKDRLHTPFDKSLPGAELQANIIDQLLAKDMIYRLAPIHELLICLFFLIFSMIDVLYFKRLNGFIWLFVLWFAYLYLAVLLFSKHHLIIPIISTSFCLLIFWCSSLAISLLREVKLKLQIKNTFNKYISAEVLDEIMKDDQFQLVNQSAEITILFSDIRRFTQYSENKTAQQLSILLNRYFEPMTTAVLEQRGTVDKFIGDAIMAFFGMPIQVTYHREQALRCVLQMHKALIKLQPAFEQEAWLLEIGIGLNTGVALVGNLGSSQRLSYTAIGDSVNLASRIESLSATYRLFCIVGESVLIGIDPKLYHFREIDWVQVKGKKEAIRLYEFLGIGNDQIKQYQGLEYFEQGVEAYRAGRFEESQLHFQAFYVLNPNDHVTEIYLTRLEQLKSQSVSNWDGVFKYESKS